MEALHERAKMIADMELLHPGWHRFSTYMHICEAADEDSGLEPEWSGVAGRVKVLLAESTQQVQSQLQLRMDEQQVQIAAMQAEIAAVKALLLQTADVRANA